MSRQDEYGANNPNLRRHGARGGTDFDDRTAEYDHGAGNGFGHTDDQAYPPDYDEYDGAGTGDEVEHPVARHQQSTGIDITQFRGRRYSPSPNPPPLRSDSYTLPPMPATGSIRSGYMQTPGASMRSHTSRNSRHIEPRPTSRRNSNSSGAFPRYASSQSLPTGQQQVQGDVRLASASPLTTPEPTAPVPLRKSKARRTSPNRGSKPKAASPPWPKSSQMANPRQRQQTTIKSIQAIPTEQFSTSSLPPPTRTKSGRTVTRPPQAVETLVYAQKKEKKNQMVAAARTERTDRIANSQQLRMMHSTNQIKNTGTVASVTKASGTITSGRVNAARSDTTLGSIHIPHSALKSFPASTHTAAARPLDTQQRSTTSKASTSISKMAGRAAISALLGSTSGHGSSTRSGQLRARE
ncbi:hypothetical protein BJ508DRAFT_330336 [Ascobolus immersus RN42]|uniref:Uncharacterized protein n=1 Tax=Ascobolus immersus RN42 TaxID=1160509 RepID=A0A3N4HVG7_ASCIM|nr:hypothetical protein BJ508DRAFT_330336 [Ascobolus immersus RN42]